VTKGIRWRTQLSRDQRNWLRKMAKQGRLSKLPVRMKPGYPSKKEKKDDRNSNAQVE
jgi:hypothetical protein